MRYHLRASVSPYVTGVSSSAYTRCASEVAAHTLYAQLLTNGEVAVVSLA